MGSLLEMRDKHQYEKSKRNINPNLSNMFKRKESVQIASIANDKFDAPTNTNVLFQSNIIKDGKALPEVSIINGKKNFTFVKRAEKLGQSSYMNSKELILLVLTLKKTFKAKKKLNRNLKMENQKYQLKKAEDLVKIADLEQKVAALERGKRLEDRKVYNLNFDLPDLDIKLKKMQDKLKEVTKGFSTQKFLGEIHEQKDSLTEKMEGNTENLKDLRGKLDVLREAFIQLNSQ